MSDVDPVIVGESLWTLRKDIHEASDHVRSIDGVGLELRFMIDGSLYHSQIFRDWPALEQAAREKRGDFEERGWRRAVSATGQNGATGQ